MAEPFAKPNEQQIKKMREFYSDPVVFWATNVVLKTLNKGELEPSNIWRDFYALARLVIINWNPLTAFSLVEIAVEDLADKKNPKWLGEEFIPPEKEDKVEIKIDPTAVKLKDKIKITDLARKYGLKVKGNKALCPFHNDKDPSLSLSDEKGVFHCFGCHVKGDLITFVRMLEDLKNG